MAKTKIALYYRTNRTNIAKKKSSSLIADKRIANSQTYEFVEKPSSFLADKRKNCKDAENKENGTADLQYV